MAKPRTTTLVVAADPPFVRPAAVTIASAWTHTGAFPTVVLGYGLSPSDESELRSRVTRAHPGQARLLAVEHLPRDWFDGLDPGGVGSVATWSRVFLGRVLGDATRALYLDSDVLVRRDLGPLLDTDLEGYTVGAVADSNIGSVADPYWCQAAPNWRESGIPQTTAVFNSGLMLIDLARWHEERIEERVLERVRLHDHPRTLSEMGDLNTVLWDRWLPLDPIWHGQNSPGKAVHFLGQPKPWMPGVVADPRLLAQYHLAARTIGWTVPDHRTNQLRLRLDRAVSALVRRGSRLESLLDRRRSWP